MHFLSISFNFFLKTQKTFRIHSDADYILLALKFKCAFSIKIEQHNGNLRFNIKF